MIQGKRKKTLEDFYWPKTNNQKVGGRIQPKKNNLKNKGE